MTSILSGLFTAQQALANQQFGLSITQRNIANANDPSYTREDAVFTQNGSADGSGGVSKVSVDAFRNRFIDYSISQEQQLSGENSATLDALQQIDSIFNEANGQGLDQALSDFFNSFSSLANTPEDPNLRQQVLTSANALATEFHQLYSGIQRVQSSEDSAAADTVDEINTITAQIADLNKKIPAAQGSDSGDEFMLRDQRQQLIEQLSGLVDLSYFETESGSVTVTTKQGGLLVAGNQNHDLKVFTQSSGMQGIQLDGVDITSKLESGKLGGLLNVRDGAIANCLKGLDDLAAGIIARVNAQHALGSDLNGAAGGDFFTQFVQPSPGSNAGAARAISVAISDPSKIAAAASGAGSGDNQNAMLLSGIKDEKLFSSSSETANQFYSGIIYQVGAGEQAAQDGVTTQNNVLDQLKNQRDSFSGVNLDEEAVNIIKYQKAYEASAKFASVLNTLSNDLLQILGGTTA